MGTVWCLDVFGTPFESVTVGKCNLQFVMSSYVFITVTKPVDHNGATCRTGSGSLEFLCTEPILLLRFRINLSCQQRCHIEIAVGVVGITLAELTLVVYELTYTRIREAIQDVAESHWQDICHW